MEVTRSAQAEVLLRRLSSAVEEGVASKAMQRVPHLVLLAPAFYKERLRPLLARWLLLLLLQLGLKDLTPAEVRYLVITPKDLTPTEVLGHLEHDPCNSLYLKNLQPYLPRCSATSSTTQGLPRSPSRPSSMPSNISHLPSFACCAVSRRRANPHPDPHPHPHPHLDLDEPSPPPSL